ncbi:hypothetical protein FSP39_013054 [Pinctada imbricata]|uniref:Uncharacterized protein n=1 Tax=Pinctada imbricata TaxID=66713 RepID=A0AA88YCU3_PINIB|nr:hypothetical protein FSP39_013054 [Pinctada imbricata]
MKMIGKASMEMEECDNTMSSMCYSYPITAEKGASTCDTDWYGHVFMDKCYRAIKDIDRIPYLNYQYGTKLCQALGGRIAEIRDGFGGKFIMLTLLKSMREFNMQGEPPGVWVNSEPIGTSCTMLTRSGPLAVSCDTNNMAVTICEKTATNPGLTLEHASDHQHMTYPVYFYSDDANKELTCGITGHANELPTLWFKDGRLIDIRVKKRLESVLPHQGGRPISPLPEPAESPTSSLILGSVLKKTLQRSTDQFLTDDVFQGTYWCEVWDLKPFTRHSSAPYSVRFSDVVTMVGTVHLPFIRNDDVILHDKIQKNVNTVRNVEYDLNFINSIILPSLRRAVPDIKELSTYAKEIIGTKPFTLKFHTYIKMNGNYSMATEIMIFRTLRRFYREVVRNPEVLLRLPRKTPLHLIRSMNVRSTVSCPQTLLTDTITGHSATFPSSAIGMKVDSFEICGGERSGQAFCTGDFSSGAYWTDVHIWKSCGQSLPPPPNTVNLKDSDEVDDTDEKEDDDSNDYDTLVSPMTPEERLKELAEMTVGEDNVEGVMEETADITESVDDLNELDVEYIAEIMKKTANTARIGKFVAAKAMRTVDRVLSMHHRRAVKSRKASQIIKNFEKIAEDAEIDDDSGHFRMVMSNIALDVYQLHRHKRPVLGFGAKAAQTRRMDSDFSPNRIFTIYDQTDMYRDVDVAIQLPPDLIDEATAGKRRLFMMVYKKGNLFQDDSIPINVSGKVNVDGGHDLKLINSYVISASLGGKKIQGLSNKVKTIYRPLTNPDGSQRTCAFYDFAMNNLSGGWSSAGCVFNGTSNGREICLCDHLTNFAVLIDFYGQRKPVEREHEETLSIISLIGLSLSILGLSLTIISYLFFRKLRQGRAQQTLFNLALAMLFSWVVFLVGIKQTYHYIGCLIVAALLHYFILASFMWMLMEAFLQYLTFVKVLGTYVRRYTLKSVLVAWGLPAVPVISVLSIDYTLYKGGDQYCWMSLDAFYYAFAIPVGVIILSNLIVFVITVVSIYRRPAGLRSNQSKHKMAITNLQAAITSFVLLGLSWILGYFAISDARLPFHYAFTILNSLQGFFIFVIFVVRKKQVRDQWLIACCCKTPEQQKAQRSLSASASIPSTCSAKSTRSSSSTSSLQQRSRPDRSDSCQTTTSFISAEYDSIYALPYSKVSRDSLYYRKF